MQSLNINIQPCEDEYVEDIIDLLEKSDLPVEDIDTSCIKFFTAETSSKLIGAIGLEFHGGYALLRSLAVAPKYRGNAVGQRLVSHLLTYCEEEWIDDVYLLTTTAASFFTALGFSEVDRKELPDSIKQTSEYQYACPSTSTVMHKHLS